MSSKNIPSVELLESVHPFPGTYQIRAIGSTEDDFESRVIAAAREELASPGELDHSSRHTRGGRHVAVTLDLTVQSAEQVRASTPASTRSTASACCSEPPWRFRIRHSGFRILVRSGLALAKHAPT